MNEPGTAVVIGSSTSPSGDSALQVDPVPTPTEHQEGEGGTVEKEDRGSTEGAYGRGVMRGGHDASVLSRLGVAARREKSDASQETPRATLVLVLKEQVRIARGTIPGTTAAQRTAAAKVVGELQARLDAMPQEHARTDWSRVPEVVRLVMTRLLTEPKSYAEACLSLAVEREDEVTEEEEREERVG